MKKHPIIILVLFLFNLQIMAQSEEESYKNKNIIEKIKTIKKKSYFNYEKGFHRFIGAPVLGYFYDEKSKAEVILTGLELGYGFFPLKNWSISMSTSGAYVKNRPVKDAKHFTFTLDNTYYLFPKKKSILDVWCRCFYFCLELYCRIKIS